MKKAVVRKISGTDAPIEIESSLSLDRVSFAVPIYVIDEVDTVEGLDGVFKICSVRSEDLMDDRDVCMHIGNIKGVSNKCSSTVLFWQEKFWAYGVDKLGQTFVRRNMKVPPNSKLRTNLALYEIEVLNSANLFGGGCADES